jgi:hypothetical protein
MACPTDAEEARRLQVEDQLEIGRASPEGQRVRRRLTEGGHYRIKSGLYKWGDGRDLLAIGGLCGPFTRW